MVIGCEIPDVDNVCLPAASDAAKGENILLGYATEKNYATLTATCNANGHKLIGLSPIDINIAKQVNILISEAKFPVENTVIFPSTGGLGYGIEYCYSIMERGRLAALAGDKLLAQPVMCDIGQEAWHAKEARTTNEETPTWGDQPERGIMWEVMTATMLLQAGADLLVMRHPEAVKTVRTALSKLVKA
jgi:acetyl-CoA decarbonylase/synthase complex subunit delta